MESFLQSMAYSHLSCVTLTMLLNLCFTCLLCKTGIIVSVVAEKIQQKGIHVPTMECSTCLTQNSI